MNPLLKTLIIGTLIYYLVKGLIYLLLWQATVKMEQRGKERKQREKEKRMKQRGIWQGDDKDDLS